jgi:small subunit ribosomal protein S19
MEIKKKQFKYKGKTIEELQKLTVREFAKYLPSRQKRAVLRNFQEIEKFVSKSQERFASDKKIRTHKRYIVVVPKLIGMKIQIHNGNNFIPVQIVNEMLGHRFGEFAPTRARVKHTKAGVGATKGSKAKSKK